jgi:putative transposase
MLQAVSVSKGFHYRIYPTPEQETLLRRTLGCARLVWNRALGMRSEMWRTEKKSFPYGKQSAALTEWKKEPALAFLNEVSSVPLQQALRHQRTAFKNFFEKTARYPRFKKKSRGGSAEFTRSGFRYENGELTLAKMDAPIDVRWSRPLPEGAEPSTVTVSLDTANRWHVSFRCEDPAVQPLPKIETAVGVDLGITTLATLSTGEKIGNPRHGQREESRTRRLSRAFSRTKKGSNNRYKARIKLARHHATIADRRRDHLHKLTTRLVHENQVIAVETLNVKGMVKNRSLARAISDAGWSEMLTFLAYKCAWYGRAFVKVDRFHPSTKTCHECKLVLDELPLSVREWTCPGCGAVHDRDVNAAINILAAGLAVVSDDDVCGLDVRHLILRDRVLSGMKQKLSGAISGIPSL